MTKDGKPQTVEEWKAMHPDIFECKKFHYREAKENATCLLRQENFRHNDHDGRIKAYFASCQGCSLFKRRPPNEEETDVHGRARILTSVGRERAKKGAERRRINLERLKAAEKTVRLSRAANV